MKFFKKTIKFDMKKIFKKGSKAKENPLVFEETEMDEWEEPSVVPAKKRNPIFVFIEKYSLIFFMLLAWVINFAIETISRYSFVEAFTFATGSWQVFLYNSFLIFVTLTLTYLFKRRVFASMMVCTVWLIGGIANGAVLSYRTTPFTGTDMKLIKSALSLITKYMTLDLIILAGLLASVVIGFLIYMGIRGPQFKGKRKYKRNIIFITLMFLSIIPVTKVCVEARVLSTYFGNIQIAYEDYGFPYCFWCTVIARGIDMPNNYDKKQINAILKEDGEDEYDETSTPNIIFIQLESFIDPELIKGYEYSSDPIPYYRSLKDNFTSGYLTVPVVGAGTANTEFEIITGMSLRFFGPGEYPYKTIMKDNVCESIAYDLRDIGYTTQAIHNNEAYFYSRRSVFSRLGFDTFTAEEMMDIKEYTPLGWAKDATLKESIMDCLTSTENQDFVYTITVQSHGGYPSEQMLEDPAITISGQADEAKANAMEYYVNEISEVDQFIGDLIEELSTYEEDTVVVLFGDHQPSLNLSSHDLVNGSLFQTEYVIWDNMGLKEEDENITSYQLAAFTLEKLDMHLGTLMKYHQERLGTSNYFSDLQMLQYDMLYGEKFVYGGVDKYKRVGLIMGVKDVNVTSVKADNLGNIVVEGGTFNIFSKISVNGKEVETTYVDENTLTYPGTTINLGDYFSVNQTTATGIMLRQGNSYSPTLAGGNRYRTTQ